MHGTASAHQGCVGLGQLGGMPRPLRVQRLPTGLEQPLLLACGRQLGRQVNHAVPQRVVFGAHLIKRGSGRGCECTRDERPYRCLTHLALQSWRV